MAMDVCYNKHKTFLRLPGCGVTDANVWQGTSCGWVGDRLARQDENA